MNVEQKRISKLLNLCKREVKEEYYDVMSNDVAVKGLKDRVQTVSYHVKCSFSRHDAVKMNI